MANKITKYSAQTGWGVPASYIEYGQPGLVGHQYKELYLEFDFGTPVSITGTETDYDKNPYKIKVGNKLISQVHGSHTLNETLVAQKVQIEWEKTNNAPPTSGGRKGLHFKFLGCYEASQGKHELIELRLS